MHLTENFRVERNSMHLLLMVLIIFAFWTTAHQISTFVGISWTVAQFYINPLEM